MPIIASHVRRALVLGLALLGACASTTYSESECGIKPANYQEIVRQWHASVERDGSSIYEIGSISAPEPKDRDSQMPGWRVFVTDSSASPEEALPGGAPGHQTFVSLHSERNWVLTIRDGKVVDVKRG